MGWLLYLAITIFLCATVLWIMMRINAKTKGQWIGPLIIGILLSGIAFIGIASFGYYLAPSALVLISY